MFKVGDIVRGTTWDYGVTTQDMTRAVVIKVHSHNAISVRILQHENRANVGDEYEIRSNAVALIETENIELEVGDDVEIIDKGRIYSSYDTFYNKYKTSETKKFAKNSMGEEVSISNGMIGKIMSIAKHETNGKDLAIINMRDMNVAIIIDLNAITRNTNINNIKSIAVGEILTHYRSESKFWVCANKVDRLITIKLGEDKISVFENINGFRKETDFKRIVKPGDTIKYRDRVLSILSVGLDGAYKVRDVKYGTYDYISATNNDEMKIVDGKDYKMDFIVEGLINVVDGTEKEKEDCERKIASYTSRLNELWRAIAEAKTNITKMGVKLKALNKVNTKELKKNMEQQVNNIFELPQVKDLKVVDDELHILTNRIDFYDLKGNKFEGNEYDIHLNISTGALKFNTFGDANLYISYWNKDEEMSPHPHIGEPEEYCLGNAGDLLCEYISEGNIFNSVLVVISFLEQCNESDWAGEWVGEWKCIDEDGNEIDNPHSKKEKCYECGEAMNGDDVRVCSECSNVCCEDHSEWIEAYEMYICENCRDNCYVYCDVCGQYHKDDKVCKCEECGKFVCESCSVDKDDETYCSFECMEMNNFECGECREYVNNCDKCTCRYCGSDICYDCVLEEHNHHFCNNDCLNYWEEENMEVCSECEEKVLKDDVIEDGDLKFCSQSCHQVYIDVNSESEEKEDENTSDEE